MSGGMSQPGKAADKWYVLDGAIVSNELNDYGNFIVASCQRERTEQDEANLRLIASAPELLSWLRQSVSFLRAWANSTDLDKKAVRINMIGAFGQQADFMEAAIARAEGRQP